MHLCFAPTDWLKSEKKKDSWDVSKPVGQVEAAGVRQKPPGRSQGTWKRGPSLTAV